MNNNILDVGYPANKINAEFYNIGKNCNTDKIHQHYYNNYYPKFIEYYKNYNNLAMLEIGVENKYSIHLWLEYFPKAFIYGVDINISDEGDDRYKIFRADQSNVNDLNNLIINITKPLFLIIDDGSHVPEHQILTFDYLFNSLLPGGTYLIEDIVTSYWKNCIIYGY